MGCAPSFEGMICQGVDISSGGFLCMDGHGYEFIEYGVCGGYGGYGGTGGTSGGGGGGFDSGGGGGDGGGC